MCERPAIDGVTHLRCRARYAPDGLTSFFHYDGVVKKAVKSIKYRFVSDLASEFVSLVPVSFFDGEVIRSWKNAVLIPVPLHPDRLRQRGFNQAEVLGQKVSAKLHIPMRADILMRAVKTPPQVDMKHRNDRLKNMNGAFAVHASFIPDYISVVLFDDVFTTGATMRAAANSLKRGGIRKVWGFTMAR